jgi:SAM-dependent methyltransferase
MSNKKNLDLLAHSWVYGLSQFILAPGADKAITQKLNHLVTHLPAAHFVLDVGCGPSSWLWRVGLHPVGIDLSPAYSATFSHKEELAVVGTATTLPFFNGCFDAVWGISLLHHLPDNMARHVVSEMLRVCRPGGYIVLFDAVLPESGWRHPIAYVLRYLDRGQFMRREEEFKEILKIDNNSFFLERITYSLNGLEAMLAYRLKTDSQEAPNPAGRITV